MESIIGKLMHKLKTEHTCFKVATKINIQGFICQLQNFKLRNIFLKNEYSNSKSIPCL